MARPRSDIRVRLLDSARRRFLKEGVDGASLRAIASDAKTNIGMVYYYFPTKDDLFFAVVEEVYARILSDMTRALEPDVSVKDRVARLYERLGALDDIEIMTVQLIVREVLVSSERLERLVGRYRRGHIPLVLATLAEGVADGSIDERIPPPVVLLCTIGVGAFPQAGRRIVEKNLGLGSLPAGAAYARQLVDVLWNGIGRKTEGEGSKQPASRTMAGRAPRS
ncbi:MAG TPA: TetR/AcrR family transcriptional regulator [Polyangiaceae bacterium]|nr:TetR/AcrR family transcriptional regulator [Polyangiaceae bacterium]